MVKPPLKHKRGSYISDLNPSPAHPPHKTNTVDGPSWDPYNLPKMTRPKKDVFKVSGDVFFRNQMREDSKLTTGL